MAHFGLICSPVPGHLNPICSLGHELLKKGHRVSLINIADTKSFADHYGVEFIKIGEDYFPEGSREKKWRKISVSSGVLAYLRTLEIHRFVTRVMCRDVPEKITGHKIDALIVDQIQFQGKVISDYSKVPFVTVACALHVNSDSNPNYPPPIVSWTPDQMNIFKKGWVKFLYFLDYLFPNPSLVEANKWAKKWGTNKYRDFEKTFSDQLQIIPFCREFDFERFDYNPTLKYVGGLVSNREKEVPFPYEKLDGRPVVYASLGTIHNGVEKYYKIINDVFKSFPQFQLVISLGSKNVDPSRFKLDHALVVNYAPQVDLIKKCEFMINHAGANCVSECLKNGTPMISIPIANDQPAMAARVDYFKLGKRIPVQKLTENSLSKKVSEITSNNIYQNNCLRYQGIIKKLGGASSAASLVNDWYIGLKSL